MSDIYPLTAPVVKADGAELSQASVQLAFNQLAGAVRIFLNQIASGGTFVNPTITGGTIDNTVIGGLVPAAGTFTTLSATSLTLTSAITVPQGGTGLATLSAHAVLLGEGTSNVAFAAPGAAGQMLLSTGATTDPAFGNNPTITGGTVNGAVVGGTTPAAGTFTTLNSTGGALNGTIGGTTPAAGTFTTVSASTAIGVASGGTGRATLTSHGVLIGEGTAAIGQTAAGTTGQMLLGVTGADPAFGNNPTITGGAIDNAVIGSTTKAAGSFTTIVATGTITPSSTNGIVGTATNDNANAGSVGEYVSATQASNVSLTTATTANVTSISLTAGDWDVTGLVNFSPSVGMSVTLAGISTTSATLGALGTVSRDSATSAIFSVVAAPTPVVRISIASTTTVFLVCQALFASGTVDATGVIRARRVR